MAGVEHIRGQTYHGRRGGTRNAFRYAVDYLLLDAEADLRGPRLFSRNRRNLFALFDSDHGGPPGDGRGAPWVREVLAAHGLAAPARIELLAQPRVLGHVFNPVSFWLCHGADGTLRAVIAEVTNTYGDRHSYLCHRDGAVIGSEDRLSARKLLHVSPFQPVAGEYTFTFRIEPEEVAIHIDYRSGNGGLVATLTGPRRPLTDGAILRTALRRPFGSRRVLALIHWQALKLWWKGARFRGRPAAPMEEVSR
ncbi:Putative cyclopropane/cyclopropene fatty acid synthesis protein [Oceanicola granulosus HTCC2516]|uniref:Putative cyclopropane/cyclopropene fatty acid synthesis protein n=1 Tax=Oceanicola granulosus (strain ATCC BAA-861 / DSM 15982 / KCTC 12143 / HTCC2516) TaxID=314256 RepID=Q2CKD9_OCEGH|nr:DUF1365 domain-containing protein [Oceanicola granulosus]EAR52850.1 Putative cyclopropane/cyclopropene fatty acid synthesis protein [Oceanicola granulosus HTCC2516]